MTQIFGVFISNTSINLLFSPCTSAIVVLTRPVCINVSDGCIEFLKKQAKGLDLPVQIYTVVSDKPIVVLTWQGLEPALPAVLLNSHMDVVPVFPVSQSANQSKKMCYFLAF